MHSNDPERLETLATPIELSNHYTTNERPPTANTQPRSNNTDSQSGTTSPEPISLKESLRAACSGETLFLQLEHSTTDETTLKAIVIRVNLQQDKITLIDADSAGQRFTIAFEGDTTQLFRTRSPIFSTTDHETSNAATPRTPVGTIVGVHNLASYSR